jgi:hypothetical protein
MTYKEGEGKQRDAARQLVVLAQGCSGQIQQMVIAFRTGGPAVSALPGQTLNPTRQQLVCSRKWLESRYSVEILLGIMPKGRI